MHLHFCIGRISDLVNIQTICAFFSTPRCHDRAVHSMKSLARPLSLCQPEKPKCGKAGCPQPATSVANAGPTGALGQTRSTVGWPGWVPAILVVLLISNYTNWAQQYSFTTLAGSAGQTGSTDANGNNARFNRPFGVAVDSAGNLYVADTQNHTIRKISVTGAVSTFAGSVGQSGSTDATGIAASFKLPRTVAVDAQGTVYVADTDNHTVRIITPTGVVTTLAGNPGQPGSADGTGVNASFNFPVGVATDSTGNVFVSDTGNHTIRMIAPGGVVTTLAGIAGQSGNADGAGSIARFNHPEGLTVDASGNVYVADQDNLIIRKIDPTGVVTTLAGSPGQTGSSDGNGITARFAGPSGVAVDGAGNVYVADSGNQTIRKITPTGLVTTLAGNVGQSGGTDGTGNAATFNDPEWIAVDTSGNLFVADTLNHTIRKGTPPTTLTGTVRNASKG
ncbi:MAG: hypothetical protein EBS05_13520 [Proteobacteria bacterium]|nr:hypothetical protein [Pseudomonadota bacterium]